jgi:O-antigen/teichoic acid export membrane protein
MMIKRLILAIISLGVGFGLTVLITIVVGTTPAEYGPVYMFFTTLSLAVAIGIWLDKFMGTNILPR